MSSFSPDIIDNKPLRNSFCHELSRQIPSYNDKKNMQIIDANQDLCSIDERVNLVKPRTSEMARRKRQ